MTAGVRRGESRRGRAGGGEGGEWTGRSVLNETRVGGLAPWGSMDTWTCNIIILYDGGIDIGGSGLGS